MRLTGGKSAKISDWVVQFKEKEWRIRNAGSKPIETRQIAFLKNFLIFVAMDAQFWVYLVIAIIYGLSRLLKKPEEQPKDVGEQRPDRPVKYNQERPTERPKQLTFEELLREITEAKAVEPERRPVPAPKRYETEVVDYDEDLGEEAQDLEEVSRQRRAEESRRASQVYEEAKRQAFYRPSLEETMKVSDTKMEFGKFKAFETEREQNLIEQYSLNFKDPAGLKKAFIMSEILNRKF